MRQSPTSINQWFSCQRSYFYKYVVGLPTYPNIHTVKGRAVHKVLENMFQYTKYINPVEFVSKELNKVWALESVKIDKEQEEKEKQDAINILELFAYIHQKKIEGLVHSGKAKDNGHAWNLLRPKFQEKKYVFEDLTGVVDNIEEDFDGTISLIDYKTSNKFHNNIDYAYIRQARLYALMFYRDEKKLPNYIKINFLRFGEVFPFEVTPDMIKMAEIDLKIVKENTESVNKEDYPMCISRRCEWCDFRYECFKVEKQEVLIDDSSTEL